MGNYTIPDHVTIKQIRELQESRPSTETIKEWKIRLKKYSDDHPDLTDQQVIGMGQFDLSKLG